jgi:hypothetical protein
MTKLLIVAMLALPALAQRDPSLALRQYLELTNEQVAAVVRLNTQLNRFSAEKFNRQRQVQMEIAQEMQRETLDPMAIGVRYIEVEAIRREMQAEQARTATQIGALLTTAQRTKLQALQDVVRTYPVACEAVALNLLTVPPVAPDPNSPMPPEYYGSICSSSRWFNTSSFLMPN